MAGEKYEADRPLGHLIPINMVLLKEMLAEMSLSSFEKISISHTQGLILFGLCLWLPCGLGPVSHAQAQVVSSGQAKQAGTPSPGSATATDGQPPRQATTGSIAGTVVDQAGAVAVGAEVRLTRPDQASSQEVRSGENGQYSFTGITPGPYQLTVSSPGFETKIYAGTLRAGEASLVPEIVLNVAPTTENVKVELTQVEVAQEQVKEQEHQRVFAFIPNFYVSYVPDAAPLVPRQKFQLAFKTVSDPVTFLGAGAIAGIYQAADEFPGYGQGAEGYGKRLGAAYADIFVGTFVGSAALPSLLHQDPRYFYRGPDKDGSRLLYAISNAVMCRGDNKKRQVNYSAILGAFASGGVSYLYYPASDRNATLVVQNALVRIAEGSVAGIIQEYVLKKFTTRANK